MVDMNLMTSSATDQWATPQVVYDNIIDHLAIDPQWDLSADASNTKCPNFIDEKQDSLVTKWPDGEVCWLNPPYGNMLKKFALKCASEFDGPNPPAKVVWLVPARTDTSWFNTLTTHAKCSKVMFLKGRIKFGNQKIPANLDDLEYGVSITDGCIAWDTTENAIRDMADKLRDVLPKRNG